MAHRKATLRKLPETTRKYARLIGSLESLVKKMRNLEDEIHSLEQDSIALYTSKATIKEELLKAIDTSMPGGDLFETEPIQTEVSQPGSGENGIHEETKDSTDKAS